MPTASIYALCDPETGQPRYVGRTSYPLRSRLNNHMADAKRKQGSGHAVSLWLTELASQGRKPSIVLLEECDPEEAENTETAWIALCVQSGISVLNQVQLPVEARPRRAKVQKERKQPAMFAPWELEGDDLLDWYAARRGVSRSELLATLCPHCGQTPLLSIGGKNA